MRMRVVHLINQASSQASATTLNVLATAMNKVDAQHLVLLLGGQPLVHAAKVAGVTAFEPMGVPGGHALAGLPRLRYWLSKNTAPDLLHCWSVGTLLLASLTARDVPRLLTLTLMPSPREIHLLRMLASETGNTRKLGIVTTTSTIARELMSKGVPAESVDVLRPGIDMSLIQADQRQGLREQWELAGDEPYVVMLLSDPPTATDAANAALMLGLANVGLNNPQRPIHLLVHPDQKNRIAALNPMRPLNSEHLIITDPRTAAPWQVLSGCDAAVSFADTGAGLSLLWAMAANVPIVGHATAAICEAVEDHHSALLASPGTQHLRHLAGKLQQALTDAQMIFKLRDTARHEAFSFYSRQRFAGDLKTVYEQLLNDGQIAVPAMPSTGGLRFTGRA
jgi:glycosyltransferase involved in cell wall biosynthesis